MRINFFVSSVASIAALLITGAFVSDVYAQKRVMLSPSTDWAVSKVADKKGQGNDYCAIARRFEQNLILTFAKNQNEQISLALDFQRSIFLNGESFPVILDPGAGQQRVYNVYPTSNKAFVVRLGRDASFFSALERTGLLRIEIAGKSYNFDLSDIESGSFSLATCLTTMIMPAAGGESGGVIQANVPASYRQEINSLRHQLNDLRDENNRLSGLLDKKQETLALAPIEVENLEITELSNKVFLLEKENVLLQSDIKKAKSYKMSESDLLSLSTLREQNLKLESALSLANTSKVDLQVLKSKISGLETENKILQASIDKQSKSAVFVEDMKAQIKIVNESKNLLQKKLDLAQDNAKATFETEIKKYKAENKMLQLAMNSKGVDVQLLEQLRQQIGQMKNENRLLQETAVKAQLDLSNEKRAEFELLRIENEKAEGAYKKSISTLEETVASLNIEIEEKDAEFIAVAEQAVLDQTGIVEDSKLKNNMLETKISVIAEEHKSKVLMLEGKNNALKKQLEVVSQNVVSETDVEALKVKNEGVAVELEKALADIVVYEEKLAEKERALFDVVAEKTKMFEALKNEGDTMAMFVNAQGELDVERLENESLKAKIVEFEQGANESLALNSRIESVLLENKELVSKNNDLHLDLEKMSSDLILAKNIVVEESSDVSVSTEQDARIKELVSKNNDLHLDLEKMSSDLILAKNAVVAESSDVSVSTEQDARIKDLERKLSQSNIEKQVGLQTFAREYIRLKRYIQGQGRSSLLHYASAQEADSSIIQVAALDVPVSDVIVSDVIISDVIISDVKKSSDSSDDSKEILDVISRVAANDLDVAADVMTEAQKYDAELVYSIQNSKTQQSAIIQKEEVLEVEEVFESSEPIVANYSNDPFEEISVESQPVRYISIDGENVEEEILVENMFEPASGVENVSVLDDNSRYDIEHILSVADIVPNHNIEFVEQASGDERLVYQWQTGRVYGSAEQHPLFDVMQFDDRVLEYLEKTKARCIGDFAVMPDRSVQNGENRIDSYDIACMGSSVNSSASILFFNKGKTFTILAHEIPAEEMKEVMNIRDRLLKTISGS